MEWLSALIERLLKVFLKDRREAPSPEKQLGAAEAENKNMRDGLDRIRAADQAVKDAEVTDEALRNDPNNRSRRE